MVRYFVYCLLSILTIAGMYGQNYRRTILMNDAWKFILRDDSLAYKTEWNDTSWRELSLPHDWAFENGCSIEGTQRESGGYASGGIGWYRKAFEVSEKDFCLKRFFLNFEAVYMNSEVWVNGCYLGKRPYGYISFEYEITSCLKPGRNIVSVRVDNSREPSTRWYHGCGIYGSVSLVTTSLVRFKTWKTFIATIECSTREAQLKITSKLDGGEKDAGMLSAEYLVRTPDGSEICNMTGIISNDKNELVCNVVVPAPQLWDLSSPYLYTLVSRIWRKGKLLDETREYFGIRSVEWLPESGFWLNGRNVKIQGVCEHLEGGPVGAAWTENMMRWKIKMLKNMGCNAIRTAHNPQLPMFYDICDEMGMLVMNEVFDGWTGKAPEDYGKQAFTDWWERDLRDWVCRDRNHPCVIAYSVGNETRGEVAKDLVRVCHEEDPTRWVTSGHSGSEKMDLLGVNGHSERKRFIENYLPSGKVFIGTETPHTWQVRGYYRTKTWYRDGFPNEKQDPFETPDLTSKELFHYEWAAPAIKKNGKQHFNSSYDNGIVRINARQNLEILRDLSWYSGSFRWTGFDYLGEAGYVHGGWPFRAFMGGVIDLAGFAKDHYYLYQSQWTNVPMAHILPHWTHPEIEKGIEIPVWVYTTGESVELFLNGKSLGLHKKGERWNEMQCEWMVPWEEGVLEAVAYKNGLEWARSEQKTSGFPSKLVLKAENACSTGKKEDFWVITIAQTDSLGTLYPYGENRVYVCMKGAGEIYSLENGNPTDVETNYQALSKKAFFGLLRAFVRKQNMESKLLVGAILGDKRLKYSDRITIDIRAVDISGKKETLPCQIYYTTDGNEPTVESKLYTDPFRLAGVAMVKALIVAGGQVVWRMEERFGPEEGIYWGDDEEQPGWADIQAESCSIANATVMNELSGFQADGYVILKGQDSSVQFCQENDGNRRIVYLHFSYMPLKKGKYLLRLLNNGQVMKEKNLVVTHGKVGQWQTDEMKLILFNGANSLKLILKEGTELGIDWFDIRD